MACIGWVRSHEKQGQDLAEFPYLKAWFERLIARPAVAKGLMLGRDDSQSDRIAHDPEAQKVLFGQRARGH
jgi:GST-like protein